MALRQVLSGRVKSKQLAFCSLEVGHEVLELCFYAAYMDPEQVESQRFELRFELVFAWF